MSNQPDPNTSIYIATAVQGMHDLLAKMRTLELNMNNHKQVDIRRIRGFNHSGTELRKAGEARKVKCVHCEWVGGLLKTLIRDDGFSSCPKCGERIEDPPVPNGVYITTQAQ